MNKQSNLYTIIYIVVLVLVVGTALAYTSLSLRDRQEANVKADTMGQILRSVHVVPQQDVEKQFSSVVTEQLVVNSQGEVVSRGDALSVNVAAESKKPAAERLLPVYVCANDVKDGGLKYVLPVYGAGLWGPIWGYVAMESDGTTVFGAFFNHQGETPGLGAEIANPMFSQQFNGKEMFKDGEFLPVTVVKAGQHPADARDYVDAVSGGTITSKGVAAMLQSGLEPYEAFLEQLKSNN